MKGVLKNIYDYIGAIQARYQNSNNNQINYLSESGVRYFMETGRFAEVPLELYSPLTEDPGQGRLYLYNSSAHMTGVCVCIDSDSWQPLFEIPKMSCVLSNDTLITAELILSGYEYFQYPLYTLEDMIRMGKELTGQ